MSSSCGSIDAIKDQDVIVKMAYRMLWRFFFWIKATAVRDMCLLYFKVLSFEVSTAFSSARVLSSGYQFSCCDVKKRPPCIHWAVYGVSSSEPVSSWAMAISPGDPFPQITPLQERELTW